MTLQETTNEVEVKETQPSVEPTVYTQEELDKAVGKGNASLNAQLSVLKSSMGTMGKETQGYKNAASAANEIIAEQERRLSELEEKQFSDDPDALKGFRDLRAIKMRESKLTLKEQAMNDKDTEIRKREWALALNAKADELQIEYQVPRNVLELCQTEEQMNDIAQTFPKVAEEKKAPKFAGPGESGKGADWRKLKTGQQKIAYGLEHNK